MENLLSNYNNCLLLYDQWMNYNPSKKAWDSYIAFSIKLNEKLLTKQIHYRLLKCYPTVRNYIKAMYEFPIDIVKITCISTYRLEYYDEFFILQLIELIS